MQPIGDHQAPGSGKKRNKFTYYRRQLSYRHKRSVINREHIVLFKNVSPIQMYPILTSGRAGKVLWKGR